MFWGCSIVARSNILYTTKELSFRTNFWLFTKYWIWQHCMILIHLPILRRRCSSSKILNLLSRKYFLLPESNTEPMNNMVTHNFKTSKEAPRQLLMELNHTQGCTMILICLPILRRGRSSSKIGRFQSPVYTNSKTQRVIKLAAKGSHICKYL